MNKEKLNAKEFEQTLFSVKQFMEEKNFPWVMLAGLRNEADAANLLLHANGISNYYATDGCDTGLTVLHNAKMKNPNLKKK